MSPQSRLGRTGQLGPGSWPRVTTSSAGRQWLKDLVPVASSGDQLGALGSWLWPHPAQLLWASWGMNQDIEGLCLSNKLFSKVKVLQGLAQGPSG